MHDEALRVAEHYVPMAPARRSLPGRLAAELRARIQAGEWGAGERLPTEAELVRVSGYSRATVRQALKQLETQGLVVIQQGRGTFRAGGEPIHIGMQELGSISETIAAQGHRPGMRYRSAEVRKPTPEERNTLALGEDETVLAVERAFLADEQIVAYGEDRIPGRLLPQGFQPEEVKGSLFELLEQRAGVRAVRAMADVHAVESDDVGWADDGDSRHLYVLLDQVHYDVGGRPVMHSRLFFIEGRFRFVVMRTRSAEGPAA
jgi:GntR family transcriptional regulator